MAQAVFNDHPLDLYLQQSGELSEPMPGALPDLLGTQNDEPFEANDDVPISLEDLLRDLPPPLVQLLHAILSCLSLGPAQERQFSERFKYDIISSSSLLATSISPPLSATPSRSFSLERDSISSPSLNSRASPPERNLPLSIAASASSRTILLSVCALSSLLLGSIPLAALFASTVYYSHTYALNFERTTDRMQPTLNTLSELVSAGDLWESTIHEAYARIEIEEKSIYNGRSPTATSSPSSALRVALLSALQITQSQCDNVRQLLSALTAPVALSQLSEMYAPPSPARPTLALAADHSRSKTLPARHRARSPVHEKRSTWSSSNTYSYTALASAGSPSRRTLRRHEKMQSDLSALLQSSKLPATTPMAMPVSPELANVEEEGAAEGISSTPASSDEDVPFGPAALNLQRDRVSAGINALSFPPSSAPNSPPLSSPAKNVRHSRSFGNTPRSEHFSPSGASSRFTSMQTTRHPLSLSALNHSLAGALAAKRYAAAHLLALRFDEAEDEQYWQDVCEVMALLTSALADAAARLSASLEDAEQHRLDEQIPTPVSSRRSSTQFPPRQHHLNTFAPMPSHFARFAAHVDAINTSLSDARENLEACVSALRDETSQLNFTLRAVAENPAVQAYERLRRELGLALRECERGRERLLDLVAPPAHPESDSEGDDVDADVPPLAHDASDESDKGHPLAPASPDLVSPVLGDNAVLVHALPPPAAEHGLEELLAERLPPQGIEQVFEAEPEALSNFVRERSKVPREERIRQARARREAVGLGLTLGPEKVERGLGGSVEKWGPSGDVVNELKDVIWKVGERRRRMVEAAQRAAEVDVEVAVLPDSARTNEF